MSTLSYNFVPDECILCFEPDMTKARVLYNAKILEMRECEDARGTITPGYLIHFQGWNSSWDRVVPENFILKNNHENRQLMKRLAEVARSIKKNRQRKRRIDVLLRQHFNKRHLFDSETDTSSEDLSDAESQTFENGLCLNGINNQDTEDSSDSEISFDSANSDMEESASNRDPSDISDEEEETVKVPVHIELPDELKRKLEDDFITIHKLEKLHKLPVEGNVISILESYVRHFAVTSVCSVSDRPRVRLEPFPPPERNVDFCKEVVDGLRIMFDFTLPSLLLYNAEREQYQSIFDCKQESGSFNSSRSSSSPLLRLDTSPYLRSQGHVTSTPVSSMDVATTEDDAAVGAETDGREDIAPKLARCSPPHDDENAVHSDSSEEIVCRRMTRHSYQEEIKRSQDLKSTSGSSFAPTSANTAAAAAASTSASSSASNTVPGSRKRHHTPEQQTPSKVPRISTGNNRRLRSKVLGGDGLPGRCTPPPPLLLPSTATTTASDSPKHTPTRSHCSTPLFGEPLDKEAALERVLSWRLLPDEVCGGTQKYPSLVYGATHLLRLFVKLPDLLSDMAFKAEKVDLLAKHLNMFVDYLKELSGVTFTDNVYIDASDV